VELIVRCVTRPRNPVPLPMGALPTVDDVVIMTTWLGLPLLALALSRSRR
jgi:hypothetical protein